MDGWATTPHRRCIRQDPLTGRGDIAGRSVHCVDPAWLVRFHAGYQPGDKDWQDVRALCARFDLAVPAEYDAFRFPDEALPAVRGERDLMTPAVRADPASVAALLHEDVAEVGSSGQIWRRDALIRGLAADPGEEVVEPIDLDCAMPAPGCVLLTYRTRTAARTTLRSSLWVLDTDGQWRLRFHQGTVTGASG